MKINRPILSVYRPFAVQACFTIDNLNIQGSDKDSWKSAIAAQNSKICVLSWVYDNILRAWRLIIAESYPDSPMFRNGWGSIHSPVYEPQISPDPRAKVVLVDLEELSRLTSKLHLHWPLPLLRFPLPGFACNHGLCRAQGRCHDGCPARGTRPCKEYGGSRRNQPYQSSRPGYTKRQSRR